MAAGCFAQQIISSISTNNCSQTAVGSFKGPVCFGGIESEYSNKFIDISRFGSIHNDEDEETNAFPFSIDHTDVLGSLPYAIDAPFNAYRRQHDPTCLPDTRVDLLKQICNWADGGGRGRGREEDRRDQPRLFWLSGQAGTGKSTIARTIARRYLATARLGASFFFTRNGGDVGHAGKFVTSIARQLASNIPTLEPHIYTALRRRRDIVNQSLVDQWDELVLRPLADLNSSSSSSSRNNTNTDPASSYILIVVDALDECEHDDDIGMILNILAKSESVVSSSSSAPSPKESTRPTPTCTPRTQLRIFLTSRPQISIRWAFYYQIPEAEHEDFGLEQVGGAVMDEDMAVFFRHNLVLIRQRHGLHAAWPGEEAVHQLTQMAAGFFRWASTVCRYIDRGGASRSFADNRLRAILRGSGSAALTA